MNSAIKEKTVKYFDSNDLRISKKLGASLSKMLSCKKNNQEIVIICVGTDRATGDALGPLVGQQLINFKVPNIYGSLSDPVHATNLEKTLLEINKTFCNPFIIAIDASLGIKEHIGFVTLSNCPINPGQGVNKCLPPIGDISLTGIVNISSEKYCSLLLQSTRLFTVMKLSDCICKGLLYSINSNGF